MPLLRLATMEDAKFLFDLGNDPDVRWASFDRKELEWASHQTWFGAQLQAGTLWIVEAGGAPVGYLRLEPTQGGIILSLALVKASRGEGLGRWIVAQAIPMARQRWPDYYLIALVRHNHQTSYSVFTGAGFRHRLTQPDRHVLVYP